MARILFLFGIAIFWATSSLALDAFEIEVYDAEIDQPGKAGLELHLNRVFEGHAEPEYAGGTPTNQLTHITFEPSYGVTAFWELGGYVQGAIVPGDGLAYGGVKLRSKFVLPKDKSNPWGLGANFELSLIPTRFEQSAWGSEIRPIITYETGRWFFAINPILTWSWSESAAPEFEPAAKIRWDTGLGAGIGLEYYAGMGQIGNMPSLSQQEHALYIAGDLLNGPVEFNLGVGYGLTEPANPWTVKTIVGVTF